MAHRTELEWIVRRAELAAAGQTMSREEWRNYLDDLVESDEPDAELEQEQIEEEEASYQLDLRYRHNRLQMEG